MSEKTLWEITNPGQPFPWGLSRDEWVKLENATAKEVIGKMLDE